MLIREHTFETAETVKGFDYITHRYIVLSVLSFLKRKQIISHTM